MRYRFLEPLRGLAALWVFAHHFAPSDAWKQAFPRLQVLAEIGDLGVPMFFVISGYCIAAAARTSIQYDQSTSYFLYRRVRRIYPPYWFSILLVVALPFIIEGLSTLKTGHYVSPDRQYAQFLDYSRMEWLRVVSLAQAFADVPGARDLHYKFAAINSVYWTLALEVQFYFVVGFALLVRSWFYQILALVTLTSLVFAFQPAAYLHGIFLPYWPMFAVGLGVYVLFERGLSPSKLGGPRAVWLSSAVVVIAAILFVVSNFHKPMATGDPLTRLAFAACLGVALYLGEGLDGLYGRAVKNPLRWIRYPTQLLVALGAMSYSLYLVHGRLQYLSLQVSRQVFRQNSIAHDLLAIGLTLVLSYLFYLVCERPFSGGGRPLKPSAAGDAPDPSTIPGPRQRAAASI